MAFFGYFIPGVRIAATRANAGCLCSDTAETAHAGGWVIGRIVTNSG